MDFDSYLNAALDAVMQSTDKTAALNMLLESVDLSSHQKVMDGYNARVAGVTPSTKQGSQFNAIASERDAASDKIISMIEEATSQKKAAIIMDRDATIAAGQAKLQQDTEAAQRAAIARTVYGMDLSDPSNIVVAAKAEHDRAMQELQAVRQARMQQPNAFQTILMGANGLAVRDAKLAAQEQEIGKAIKLNQEVLSSMQAATMNQINIDRAAAPPSVAMAEAARDKAEAQAASSVAAADIELAKTYASEAQRVAQQKLQAENMRALQADREERTEAARVARIQSGMVKSQKEEAERQVDKAFRDAITRTTGQMVPAGELINENNIRKYFPDKQKADAILDAVTTSTSSGVEVMGSNPARAVLNANVLVTGSNANAISSDVKAQTQVFSQLYRQAQANKQRMMGPAFDALKANEKEQEIAKEMQSLAAASLLKANTAGSIYAPTYDTLLGVNAKTLPKSHPAHDAVTRFQRSPIAESLRAEFSSTGTVNDSRVFKIAADLVNGKKLSHRDATLAVASYYQAAVQLNNASMQYEKWGLSPQSGYFTDLDVVTSAFGIRQQFLLKHPLGEPVTVPVGIEESMKFTSRGAKDMLDLTKPATVSYILVVLESEKVLGELRGGGNPPLNKPAGK